MAVNIVFDGLHYFYLFRDRHRALDLFNNPKNYWNHMSYQP